MFQKSGVGRKQLVRRSGGDIGAVLQWLFARDNGIGGLSEW